MENLTLTLFTLFVSIFISLNFHNSVLCKQIQRAESTLREESLDEKYVVYWEPNFDEEIVEFKVIAETNGFIGFGISFGGGMTDADIVIGGVYQNGSSYFADYHGVGSTAPILDESQDYQLLMFEENATHTTLTFSRAFDTCDENDIPITEASMNFIWSYGTTDQIGYHNTSRGSSAVNILDPPMPPLNLTNFETWSLTRNTTMPAEDTSYWCTIHKRPMFDDGPHHIIGFDAFIQSPEAKQHSHHIVVSQCVPPEGQTADELFGPHLGFAGEECYDQPTSRIPKEYCRNILYVWAVGGKATLFPEHVGYPINEPGHENEYVLLEVHYDNPEKLKNVTFETGIIIYHTPKLRPNEAGLLLVEHEVFPSHIIPPGVTNYTTVGHCSPNCTAERAPATGIHVFNILLHSHLAGRKLRLRQYRNGVELPWVANDEHYNFNFQQNRPLRDEITILPGDQLAYECVTDTTDRNKTTLAGLSTRHEMCEAFLWYYPRQNWFVCGSVYPNIDEIFEQFGIGEVDWETNYHDPTVLTPSNHAGKTISQVMDEYAWTTENKAEFEIKLRYSNHYRTCFGPNDPDDDAENLLKSLHKFSANKISKSYKNYVQDELEDFAITYPAGVSDYVPHQFCSIQATTDSASSTMKFSLTLILTYLMMTIIF